MTHAVLLMIADGLARSNPVDIMNHSWPVWWFKDFPRSMW